MSSSVYSTTIEIVRGDFGLAVINSKFEWLLSGPTEFATSSETTVTNLIISGNSNGLFDHTRDPLVDTLKQFWEAKSIGIKGEFDCEQSSDCFNDNVRFKGERYEVELPWKENRPVYQVITNCGLTVSTLCNEDC